MDLGSLLVIIALAILVAWFVAQPLMEKRSLAFHQENEHTFSALLAERDRILDALQELDFDHALGRLTPEDYTAQRTRLTLKGAAILKQLDSYTQKSARGEATSALEALVTQRKVPASTIDPDDEIEALLAARRRKREDKSGGFCPQCGSPVLQSDQFCSNCGQNLI